MTLYQNKYRVETTRLKDWDCSWPGWYFVTICIKDKRRLFGEVIDCMMQLSALGDLVQRHWLAVPSHYSNIWIDDFVVMPNHFHGIVQIHEPRLAQVSKPKGSLLTVIGFFKAGVTRECRKLGIQQFNWQSRYFDEVIRNGGLSAVRDYIFLNPANWQSDEHYF